MFSRFCNANSKNHVKIKKNPDGRRTVKTDYGIIFSLCHPVYVWSRHFNINTSSEKICMLSTSFVSPHTVLECEEMRSTDLNPVSVNNSWLE